jgi:predicted acetyltransferase
MQPEPPPAASAADVAVRPAGEAERPLLESLFQFYAYDFSEIAGPDAADFDFDAAGRMRTYEHMGAYWREASRWPLLIRTAGRLAGFALINTHSHRGGRVERNMAEFFVARRYRRHGVASAAVRQILGLYPGDWEVAVTERNVAAQAFWPRAIAATPNVSRLRTVDGDGQHWRGPIHCFHAA